MDGWMDRNLHWVDGWVDGQEFALFHLVPIPLGKPMVVIWLSVAVLFLTLKRWNLTFFLLAIFQMKRAKLKCFKLRFSIHGFQVDSDKK